MRGFSRAARRRLAGLAAVVVAAATAALVLAAVQGAPGRLTTPAGAQRVHGQDYQVCNLQQKYLTSPWTYHALHSGRRSYTVAQYEALPGYGTALPPLPSYVAAEGPSATAAFIYAPGSDTGGEAYEFPATPVLYFFEGGAYGEIDLQSVTGDEFIGGSAPGYPEPAFDDAAQAGGISAQNDNYDFSGGSSPLAAEARSGATSLRTVTAIGGYIGYATVDGHTYQIASHSGTSITLASGLVTAARAGSVVYADDAPPIAFASAPASQGATTVNLGRSRIPLLPYGRVVVGADSYLIRAVSGNRGGYSLRLSGRGLDVPASSSTPVYYAGPAGGVHVEYLDISHDLHVTTATIDTGSGWTVEHNRIHDGYRSPGEGVAVDDGDESTIDYNCFSRMGDYAFNLTGADIKVDFNEVYETNYRPDPGCGCSGGGKWWGTLNADILDNAFIDDSPSGGSPIWLDNGNSGTDITGNYFFRSYASAVDSETGFDLRVSGNLFADGGWGDGKGGCGSNCDGAVNLNSTGGWPVPGSRYENEVLISGNRFVDDWMGVDVWQSGSRSCENSGEGGPAAGSDSAYCSGGFPNTASPAAGGQYYFSHIGDSGHSGSTVLAQPASAGDRTITVAGAEAIRDKVGFGDPAATTTSSRTGVSRLADAAVISVASTRGFPSSGELRVGTSAAWHDGAGSYTGAILSYTGTTPTSFTGISLASDSGAPLGDGRLSGPVLQVQPYTVTAETCYANDCRLTLSQPLAAAERAGTEVSNAGTCQLYATSAALPSGPLAPDGISYWDGCQWEARNISVTGNTFVFQPAVVAAGTPLTGSRSTSCTAGHADACGTNFMAYQTAGDAPFDTQITANAMMSSSSFTGCPEWDAGCATDPLRNLNALASPPGTPGGTGAAPFNDVWSHNAYAGPWAWSAYLFGDCSPRPQSMHASGACTPTFASWQSDWQQDVSSTSTAASLSPSGSPDAARLRRAAGLI